MHTSSVEDTARRYPGTIAEVFWVFLRLGLTSFGGPVAHLGYFREAFVERRRWLDDRAYADLVALCQFLPGPASSQVGMALGLQRAGFGGLLAAWVGFTLPSALLLLAFAYGVTAFGDFTEAGWLHGLKAAAVAVVAHALFGMARTLTPDAKRATIAVAAMIAVLLAPNAFVQVGVILATGIVGLLWLRPDPAATDNSPSYSMRVPRWLGISSLATFGGLLLGLPALAAATGNAAVGLFDTFYRAGALVFGGGHVVLPLLQAETVQTGLVTQDAFLAGYGAAQAVPGPLFTFAAYLGGVTASGPSGAVGASIALVAIFLPATLLVIGVMPFWDHLRRAPCAQRALMGVNAGVVGILAAALYTPVFTDGITGIPAFAIAAAAFVALTSWKAPAWTVVLAAALLGWLIL
ncbi:MAG: chromate efflux transporter [Gulosibacter sp.]|uniref:chromate efflux transporter n=1 Tax=Gulosibacter sp. TaxID=2817531 RepID=UPI003F93EB86